MDTVKTISAQVERLPLRLQEEVLHFVRHLVLRNTIEADVCHYFVGSAFYLDRLTNSLIGDMIQRKEHQKQEWKHGTGMDIESGTFSVTKRLCEQAYGTDN